MVILHSDSPLTPVGGSFRDPSGRVYSAGGQIVRTIQHTYAKHWEAAQNSGFAQKAVERGLLLEFTEIPALEGCWKTLKAPLLPFISYPYEWCFGQLKDAALHTLSLMTLALEHGMILKDASAYNMQFLGKRPIFIDHLSFEVRDPYAPWLAYLQFCKHFLAPLALMRHRGPACGKLLSLWLDGLPLDLASSLLPFRTRFSPLLQLHIHTHARMQKKHSDARKSAELVRSLKVNEQTVPRLCESLRMCVQDLWMPTQATEWGDYYEDTNYTQNSAQDKAGLVRRAASEHRGNFAVDLGANTGVYSRLLAEHFTWVLAADFDHLAVEKLYAGLKRDNLDSIIPLALDLTNPSPALGWAGQERDSFAARCQADFATALAVIHHLVLGAGIPLVKVAEYFAGLLQPRGVLALEFVPLEDSQVQRLMAARENIFADYNLEGCSAAFGKFFEIQAQNPIAESRRTLLILRKREQPGTN